MKKIMLNVSLDPHYSDNEQTYIGADDRERDRYDARRNRGVYVAI
ncbi:hypothetical protein [Porphyromonas endodontalis]